jgi:erythromycin esterase-like protein
VSGGLHTPFTAVRALAQKLDERPGDYDALLAMAEGKQYVLLGEATHGTREFYRMRAEITRRLLTELRFDAVAVEADWPDAWQVNRWAGGEDVGSAEQALARFERFPAWMWRNREVLDFVTWLRQHNAALPVDARVGFYGLDLYSLYRSADDVVAYLRQVDPDQAEVARRRYAALDHVRDPQNYGYEAAMSLRPSCEDAVRRQLDELRGYGRAYAHSGGTAALDAQFAAERNAAAVVDAEAYYRAMFGSRINTWNLRDAHMRDSLFALAGHRRRRGGSGRIVVWAHNSHLGDARATEMHRQGEFNLGQLVREAVGDAALLVGFTTYTGHVCAASAWDGEPEHKRVLPALPDSWERLFHGTRLDRFFLPLREAAAAPLRDTLLERAIGVIYLPKSERLSHYFDASLARQFDAVFHLDETSAVEPLDTPKHWPQQRQAPDTYPFGI